jgi:two-component system, NarL family, invasion response regulator UvrY
MRILIADDHPVVRRGLRQFLEEEIRPVTIAEAGNGPEVLEALERDHWDLLLLDVSMPGRGGIDILKDVKARLPSLPVLMLSAYPEEQFAVRALRAGAAGYLTKDVITSELISAVRKVGGGGRYVTEALAERLAAGLADSATRLPHELLSDREYEVLRRIGLGRTVGEIAAELHLSVKTISTYRARLLEKLGMTSSAQLTRYALDNGLVD